MKKRPAVPVRNVLVAILLSTALAACGDETSSGEGEHVMGADHVHGDDHANAPIGDAAGPCTTDTWDNYAQQFFATNCVKCHKAFTSLDNIQVKDERVVKMIDSGRMPKNGHLDDAEKQRILRWLRCGMPE